MVNGNVLNKKRNTCTAEGSQTESKTLVTLIVPESAFNGTALTECHSKEVHCLHGRKHRAQLARGTTVADQYDHLTETYS